MSPRPSRLNPKPDASPAPPGTRGKIRRTGPVRMSLVATASMTCGGVTGLGMHRGTSAGANRCSGGGEGRMGVRIGGEDIYQTKPTNQQEQ
eukprot:359018-Chlamydomonas_euryale.AAC.5